VLDDTVIAFEEPVGHYFEDAGFDVHSSKRHLTSPMNNFF